MGTNERRERERQELRQKILDAARELFVAEGYEAVTMRRIAEAIEYSAAAIYFHFKDKDTLIRELCQADSLTLSAAFQSIAQEPDPIQRLRQIGKAYVAFGVEHPNHYRLIFMSSRHVDEADMASMGHGNPEMDGYAFLVATLSEAIAQGRLSSGLIDPHLLAQAVWAGLHGAVALYLTKRGDPWVDWRPLEETASLITESMINGFIRRN